jgi:hypothetical protein
MLGGDDDVDVVLGADAVVKVDSRVLASGGR